MTSIGVTLCSLPHCLFPLSAFFFKIRLHVQRVARRGPHCFAVIVDGHPGDVQADQAPIGLLEDDDGDGAALDAGSERGLTATRETGRHQR